MADDWWLVDGVVDWAVNPCGQTVELRMDGHDWLVVVGTPLHVDAGDLVIRSGCEQQARRLFGDLSALEAPGPGEVLRAWRRARARRAHPSDGD